MKKLTAAILFIVIFATMGMTSEIAFIDGYDNALKTAAAKSQNVLITFWSDT